MSRLDHDEKLHTRLNCTPNTPDAQIASFKSQHTMIECPTWRCSMAAESCQQMRRRAFRARRAGELVGMKGDALKKCITCEAGIKVGFSLRPPKTVRIRFPKPAVYGACMDCKQHKRIVCRERCSTCYSRYRSEVRL